MFFLKPLFFYIRRWKMGQCELGSGAVRVPVERSGRGNRQTGIPYTVLSTMETKLPKHALFFESFIYYLKGGAM
jgi:hypothetical protein